MGKVDSDKVSKGIAIIEESAKIQNQLISDLLDVSRIIAGKVSIDIREVNLSEIIQAAVESIASTAKSKSIHVDVMHGADVGTVMADRTRLQQVFWNLLSNAVKFSSAQSRVAIHSERLEAKSGVQTQVLIHVEDSGKGINPDFLQEIFHTFSQEDSSSIRLHGGLGLGLAIVRNLVELHGGTVEARNKTQGKGAIFTVCLPLKSTEKLRTPPQVTGNGKAGQLRLDGIRVLIVDDEVNSRVALTEVLRSFGANVSTAKSASEALAFFEKLVPDVLVSDVAMPEEDGYSLIRKIRALASKRGGNTPALALTAYAGDEDIQRALSAGFQAHLAKPVEVLRLVEAVHQLCDRSAMG